MKTKWDLLLSIHESKLQTQLASLKAIRESTKTIINSLESVVSRQEHYKQQLVEANWARVEDWELTKRFLSDLEVIRLRCSEQRKALEFQEAAILKIVSSIQDDIRKFEWLREQKLKSNRMQEARQESELLEEWTISLVKD
jgi:flagellar biosynthesis chaperone FliJ